MKEAELYAEERNRMVDTQIESRGIKDKRVLESMRIVPRHCFIPPEHISMAYADGPLPIGEGQTISQPYIVALMTDLLKLKGDEKVLEIGTGSGYQAAILAHLAKEVHTMERHAPLTERAKITIESLGHTNVEFHVGDGSKGLPEHAPFQAIIITAAAPSVPEPLVEQLDDGARLVVPVGSRFNQLLELWTREAGDTTREVIAPVAFVPLRGEFGWEDDGWSSW
jgi:protein-L-isoaspartate(D-aspartate) O-methyltransferase